MKSEVEIIGNLITAANMSINYLLPDRDRYPHLRDNWRSNLKIIKDAIDDGLYLLEKKTTGLKPFGKEE